MPDPSSLFEVIATSARHSARAHEAYLRQSRDTFSQMAEISRLLLGEKQIPQDETPIYDYAQLVEFATGSIARCFGSEYQVFEGRRYPRIPNGELLLMSRIRSIQGTRRRFLGGERIHAEYDVPEDAWFYTGEKGALPPYSALMEIALQPCGFLSAWMGTSFLLPDVDLYFRNLDGSARILSQPDLRGQTVTCTAELLSTIPAGQTILQKYRFSLMCRGTAFYEGESTFGYFPGNSMSGQAGLDGSEKPAPWYTTASRTGSHEPVPVSLLRPVAAKLRLLDQALLSKTGGRFSHGYVAARRTIDPSEWYFRCHFFQDPVMPGSLGIDAMFQAIRAYAIQTGLAPHEARFSFHAGRLCAWKYRGQILPSHHLMEIKADITGIEKTSPGMIMTANASLWADGLRIYAVDGLALQWDV